MSIGVVPPGLSPRPFCLSCERIMAAAREVLFRAWGERLDLSWVGSRRVAVFDDSAADDSRRCAFSA